MFTAYRVTDQGKSSLALSKIADNLTRRQCSALIRKARADGDYKVVAYDVNGNLAAGAV